MILCCYIPCIKWFDLLQYIVYFTKWLWQPDSIKKRRDKRNGYDVTKNSTVSLSMWKKQYKTNSLFIKSQLLKIKVIIILDWWYGDQSKGHQNQTKTNTHQKKLCFILFYGDREPIYKIQILSFKVNWKINIEDFLFLNS